MPKTKHKEQEEMTAEKPLLDMAENAMRNYEQAVRTSLRLQEEANRWWSTTLSQASMAQDWQKRVQTMTQMANNLMPLAQRRMEELMEMMEKNSRQSAELVKKAADAAQTPVLADSQAKWIEFWTASMGAVRSNTEFATQIGSRAIDSWVNFVRRNTEVTEVRVPKGT